MIEPALIAVTMHIRNVTAAFLVLAAALAGIRQPSAQGTAPQPPAPAAQPSQPPITFRVDVNYVEVDAVVTDARGNLVTDLTRADFQVFEDGVAAERRQLPRRRPAGRAARRATVCRIADRAGRPHQPPRVRRPRLCADARRSQHQLFAIDSGQAGGAAVHRALSRRERRRRNRADRRLAAGRAGVHRQPDAPAARDRRLHGPEAPLGDARENRRLQPEPRHARLHDAARHERSGTGAQGAPHAVGAQVGGRLSRRHSRSPQGRALFQRGHRLRRHQHDREPLRL